MSDREPVCRTLSRLRSMTLEGQQQWGKTTVYAMRMQAVGIISVGRPARLAECEWNVLCNGAKGEGDVGEVTSILGE